MLVLELLGDSMERVCHRSKGLKNRAAVAIEVIFDFTLTPDPARRTLDTIKKTLEPRLDAKPHISRLYILKSKPFSQAGLQLLAALERVHGANMLHNDLSLSNILGKPHTPLSPFQPVMHHAAL